MRTNEERQQLIHRRTLEIQREQQKKRERVISGSGIAAMSDDNHWNRMSDARSDKTGFCFWGKN